MDYGKDFKRYFKHLFFLAMSFTKILKTRERKTKQGRTVFLNIQDNKSKTMQLAGFKPGTEVEVTINPGLISAKVIESNERQKKELNFISMPSRQRSTIPVFCCITSAGVEFIPDKIQKRLDSYSSIVDADEKDLSYYQNMFHYFNENSSNNIVFFRKLSKKLFMLSRKFLNRHFYEEATKLCIHFNRRT